MTPSDDREDREDRKPDALLVTLAAAGAVLLVGGQLLADLAGREVTTGWRLGLDAAAALAPVVAAVVMLRRPEDQRLRQVTVGLAVAALVVVATGLGERTGAAALAVPPCLVLAACRTRLVLPPVVAWRRVSGTALGVLVAIGLLLGPGGARGHTSVSLPGGRLGDADAAIADADTRFLRDTLGATDRTPGARCYFVQEGVGGSYTDLIACGPVVHPAEPADEDEPSDQPVGSGTNGPWDLYPARVEGGKLRLGKPTVGQAAATEQLWRPDGLRPPKAQDVAAGATVSPGFSMRLSFGEPTGAKAADGFVLAGAGTVTVTEVATPASITDENGVDREAPAGYELVAANLTFENVEGTTLEVLSGHDRVDVTPTVTGDSDFYQSGWLVAVARDDGVAPLLEVTYRGRAQRLSLATGERLGDDPLLYHPRSQALAKEIEAVDVPITVPLPTAHPGEVHVGSYTIERADLRSFDPNLGWAPPGQAWLVVGVDNLGNPSFFDLDLELDSIFRFDSVRSFALKPAGSSDWLAPVGLGPTEESAIGVVFPVSDLTTEATFRATPRWRLLLGDKAIDVKAPATDVALVL